jgi:filamentous hemagglutinin family protein
MCVGLTLPFVALGSHAHAATAITPTIGSGNLGTQVLPPSGNVYGITGGKPVGNNLYHSFAQFNVGTGDVAQFQTPALILNEAMLNILGRITDTNPSIIFGTIDSATYYPGASLFLMNPYGFLFGPNATVNVGGMVAFTTADYLKLADNVRFEAIPGAQDALLSAFPVATFGFLGSNPSAIAVQGSQLTVTNGTGLSLVGGNQGFTYTDPDTGATVSVPDGVTMTGGSLSAPSGKINIASVASAGEISSGDFMPTSGMTMGNIALSQGSVLDVSGDGGGIVRIRGGQFIMDQAAVFANTTGVNDGAPTAISVNVTDGVLLNNQSALVAQATSAGRSGDIEITGRTIDVAGTSVVYTASTDSGSPGNIAVTASESIFVRGADQFGNPSEILSDSLFMASTGSIALRSPLITLEMGAIETRMFGFGAETRAGDIMIDTTNLNLISGGMIRTVSGSDIAPSGNISVTAGEAVNLIGTNDFNTTSNITNENTNGGTGSISIQTGTLTLHDQARINSQTGFDTDPAAADTAKIAIAADSIALSSGSRIDVGGFYSDVGRLDLSAQTLTVSGTSSITTLSNASGASGPIMINVQDLSVSEGSQIVSSSGQGFGRGGDVTVNATGSVLVTGQGTDPFVGTLASGIFSNTMAGFEDPSFTGNAGNISITGHSIEVSNGGLVDSSSQFFALGNAGNIDLTAPTITLNGGTIATSTAGAGAGGSITITAGQSVTLNNGSSISASSTGAGNAGNILINAGQNYTSTNSSVTTQAAHASGGNITVLATDMVQLTNSQLNASVQGSSTTVGGNITIDPQYVILQNSQILAQATHGQGGAISITITNGGLILPDATSTVSASSQFGVNGTVTIQSPNAPASGKIQPLGKTPLLATSLLNQRCAALAGGEFSSFTVAGRDSLPTEPGSWLASPLYAAGVGEGQGGKAEGERPDIPILSLRQIAPAGFLTQAFAVDWSAGCTS